MLKKKSSDNEQNFWIAYADLMAGLLFVFVLLVGAIVVKYVLTQKDVTSLRISLSKQKKDLDKSQKLLKQKEVTVNSVTQKINDIEQKNMYLEYLKEELEGKISELELDKNQTKDLLRAEKEKNSIIDEKEEEILRLQDLLTTYKTNNEEANATIQLKESQIVELKNLVEEQLKIRQKLRKDLNITRDRIKNLTGIKIRVIQELKNKLGNEISIDSHSGSIRLPSSVLFDLNSYEIKDEAKEKLKTTLVKYFDVLLGDKEIRDNIDKIIIEGHTDSIGTYMYNLDLSQKRAYEVMKFVYSWHIKDSKLLRKYLTVTGRSFSDPILVQGIEDKNASRRIEIKFSIANKKAIDEIERFLESEYQ